MCTVVIASENEIRVPEEVADLQSFRRWVYSDDFPEHCKISFLQGEFWVDMTAERLQSDARLTLDFHTVLDRIAPQDDRWEHNELNADTNGHSHARAALIGPSVTIPFTDGELALGVWQRIVCIDLDDRARRRKVIVQLLGV